jgi:ferredoxin
MFSIAGKLATADQPPLALDASQCVRAKDKLSKCELCIRACPVNALRLDAPMALDEKLCVACGACVRVCPVNAFTGIDGDNDLLNCVARVNPTQLELTCARHPHAEIGLPAEATVIRTSTCLAALGASIYVRLLSQVESIAIRLDVCGECSSGRLQADIAQAFAPVRQLFPARAHLVNNQPDTSAPARAVYDAKSPPVSRRDFLRAFTGESVRTALRIISSDENKTSATHLPRERMRLLAALKWASSIDLNVRAEFAGAIRLKVDEKCTACGVCARVCPTGALQFSKADNKEYRLTCIVAHCTDCGMCRDMCEPGALQRDGVPTLAELVAVEPMVLRAGALKLCSKCNAPFAAAMEGNLCPICDFRQRNPFGALRPRAMRE